MTLRVTALTRHPVKAVGREALDHATFTPGNTMPGDRIWAIAHGKARADALTGDHASCANFIRAASSPQLMAVEAALLEDGTHVSLRHPARPDITLSPDDEAEALLAWVAPLIAPDRPAPTAVTRAASRGYTDSQLPGITLCNAASHRAVEGRVGRPLSQARWRGNLWLDGLAPWEEFDLVGKHLRVGEAVFELVEPTERCRATEANPETGARDTDTLGALRSWGHQDFSVQAVCVEAGRVEIGADAQVLS